MFKSLPFSKKLSNKPEDSTASQPSNTGTTFQFPFSDPQDGQPLPHTTASRPTSTPNNGQRHFIDPEKVRETDPNDAGIFPDLVPTRRSVSHASHPIDGGSYPSNSSNSYPEDSITSLDHPGEENSQKPFGNKVFDAITRHAGSRYVLLGTIVLILGWGAAGLATGFTDLWQIAMQNASSFQVYLTDILLLRQQQTSSRALLQTLSRMQARDRTYARLIQQIPQKPSKGVVEGVEDAVHHSSSDEVAMSELLQDEVECCRSKVIFDESCRVIADGLGSVWAYIIYWIGIFTWIGIGPVFGFSDTWQLVINTIVAVALTFTSIFLQNRQQQQEDALDRIMEFNTKIEIEIEFRLREVTGDRLPNDVVTITPPKPGCINRFIDIFTCVMGSLYGVLITLVFIIIWIGTGPLLNYSADWWLILGTFTGLIGFIDGFVLRNVYDREATMVNRELENSAKADAKIFSQIGLEWTPEAVPELSRSSRISGNIGDWCAFPSVTLCSFAFVFILLGIATGMSWTTTGQLLCNTPTMIIEGFLLLVLIEAHCIADGIRGHHLRSILERRLMLNRYLRESMAEMEREKEMERVTNHVPLRRPVEVVRLFSQSLDTSRRISERSSVGQRNSAVGKFQSQN